MGDGRMMRDTAALARLLAVILAFLIALDQTASAQARQSRPANPVGPGVPTGTSSITGHVLTADSNSPVRAADVEALYESGLDSSPRPTRTARTASIDWPRAPGRLRPPK